MSDFSTLWQSEQNFFDAKAYFDTLIQDIREAQDHVYIESYIFEADIVGLKIIEALEDAKQRGIDIKVLVDGIGSMNNMGTLLDSFKRLDIPLKIYHPLPWSFRTYRHALSKGKFFHKLLHFTGRINHRDHRKLCIIDGHIAWTGSINLVRSHLPVEHGGAGWKDHGLRVTGENIASLAEEFLQLWNRQAFKKLQRPLPEMLSTLNPYRRQRKVKRIVHAIDHAQQRIWIANAYFAPHRSIIAALVRAKSRGVDVCILTSGKSDIFFFPSFTRSFYSDLLRQHIRIFEWYKGILHSKIILIDDFCISGSTNLNTRSHKHDLELDIMVNLPDTIKEIESQMAQDFQHANFISGTYIAKNRIYIALMSLLPKLLRYWL